MALTWTMTQMVARWRKHTGRSEVADISDADVIDIINDYYVNYFPSDGEVDEFNTFFVQELIATDDGVYAISQNVDRMDDPVTINGNEIRFYRDRELFFTNNNFDNNSRYFGFDYLSTNNSYTSKFEDEQFITAPTLTIGSSDVTMVKYVDFSYSINNYAYSADSAEVDLTGPAVPAGKYGAWSLKIDEDGTVAVSAANGNVTGYLTPRLALEALNASDSTSSYMGYVTVIKSDGTFTPATTDLDAANVTATFTDGRFESRTTPISALLYGQNLYVWPKPNDIYQFKALQIADRPTALGASDAIADLRWGPMIPLGAAILFLNGVHDDARANELMEIMKYRKNNVRSDKIKRLLGGEIVRNF
jgi:hypothetical protein